MVPAGEETISAKHLDDLSSGARRRLAVRAVLRTIATVGLVLAIYFLIPMDRPIDAESVTGLVLGVLALFAIIVWQVRQIIRSEHPSIRAVEALAFTVPCGSAGFRLQGVR
jgi:voltage-gated potassium channel